MTVTLMCVSFLCCAGLLRLHQRMFLPGTEGRCGRNQFGRSPQRVLWPTRCQWQVVILFNSLYSQLHFNSLHRTCLGTERVNTVGPVLIANVWNYEFFLELLQSQKSLLVYTCMRKPYTDTIMENTKCWNAIRNYNRFYSS